MQALSGAIIDLPPAATATSRQSVYLSAPSLATLQHASSFSLSITLQTFNTVQFWLEGIFFTAFGIVGLVGALVTIAVLATRDLRDFQTNEEVALS